MISEHQVRERAYFIWKNVGGGSADAHWLQAEAELTRSSEAAEEAVVAVQPAAEPASLAPSPAKVLPKKQARAKAATKAGPSADGPAKAAKPKKAARSEGASLH